MPAASSRSRSDRARPPRRSSRERGERSPHGSISLRSCFVTAAYCTMYNIVTDCIGDRVHKAVSATLPRPSFSPGCGLAHA